MKAPRSVTHASGSVDGTVVREFLSVAVRITAAGGNKDGFFLQLFPDLRGPQVIYLTIAQLERLLGLATGGASDSEIWAELVKIPLEPVLPARSLYPRLRNLLIDSANELRAEVISQQRRAELRQRAAEPAREEVAVERPAPPPMAHRDPDAL